MDKEVIVVIPIYRQMTLYEEASLQQCIRILGAHPIALVAGASLKLDAFLELYPFRVERFDDADFESTQSYSRLLLSDRFYARFADYVYMLIYQLDAFVFSDRLLAFCNLGYDYIGAPIPRWIWKNAKNRVGNGGFSLRKISSALRVLGRKEEIFRQMPAAWEENQFLLWEDLFFSFCATLPELDFHAPDFLTALDFSVGTDIGHAYEKIPDWLPFGCHGWDRNDYRFWKPVVERFGYHLPEPEGRPPIYGRRRSVLRYIMDRLLRDDCRYLDVVCDEVQAFLPSDGRKVALWGSGVYGRRLARLFHLAGREVLLVFDRKAVPGGSMEGIPLTLPDFDRIRDQQIFVMIATITYEEEICAELASHGFEEGKDFGRVLVLADCIVRKILHSAGKRWKQKQANRGHECKRGE